jgi:tetratricopeptide (TPR) repeat protein
MVGRQTVARMGVSFEGKTLPRERRWRVAAALLLLAALLFLTAAAGCGHVPRVIVLEDPLSADEHVALGVAYEEKGELALAAREYERALKKDASSFRARVNLGNVRLAEKRYGDAREEYLEALALRPGDPEATNNLAWAAIRSGNGLEDALVRLAAVMSAPARRSPPLLDTLGVLLGELSRVPEAEAVFAEGLRRCDAGDPACTEDVRRELHGHAEALRARGGAPASPPSLVK